MYGMRYNAFTTIFLVLCLVAAGCCHKPTMREMGIVLDTLTTTGGVPLTDSVASPRCDVDIQLITLANKEYAPVNDSLLRSGILSPEYLSLSDVSIEPKVAVDSFIKRYCDDYRTFYAGLFSDEDDADAATIGFKLRTSIEEGKDSTLCYKAFITSRQGDISTDYTVCRNIDLTHKRLLTLDDIFVHGAEKGLSNAITHQLMRQSANKTETELRQAGFFVNSEPYPTSNFILGDKSITFVYVTGEIADREKGEINVEVKYSDIKHLMKR